MDRQGDQQQFFNDQIKVLQRENFSKEPLCKSWKGAKSSVGVPKGTHLKPKDRKLTDARIIDSVN